MPQPAPAAQAPPPSLSRWERGALFALLGLVLLQGCNVEMRSVLLRRRMTDLGVYLRAAWAVRAGEDPYAVTDENEFHYVYPPLFAILLTPFADPPAGARPAAAVPFAVSAALWYAFSVLCAWLAVHWLASALERRSPDPAVRRQRPGAWRWWALRFVPLVVCLPPIFATLVHGQANLLLLALLSGMLASSLHGRPWRAGLCLAGAVCLKVFPAFLLLYPLWRRDGRCLAGCGLGLLLGLVLLPSAVWGPAGAWEKHRRFAEVVVLPGLGAGADETVAEELTNVTATDSQSLLAVLHNTLHPDRETRPDKASPALRWLAWAVVGLLTGLVLLAAGRRRRSAPEEMLFFGALVLAMLLCCPVAHLPYFCLLLPLVVALVERFYIPDLLASRAAGGPEARRAGRRLAALVALFAVNVIARILPHVPGLEVLRDLGSSMYAALVLGLLAVGVLWGGRRQAAGELRSAQAERVAA